MQAVVTRLQGADAWAVGVFAYELIVGTPPFKADQMIDTARNIIAVNLHFPATISEMARDFVTSCLRKHPGDRPTVIEMLHHPWITMFQVRRVGVWSRGGRCPGYFSWPCHCPVLWEGGCRHCLLQGGFTPCTAAGLQPVHVGLHARYITGLDVHRHRAACPVS